MGGDFTFMDADMWYKNLDKLIRFVFFFSTSQVDQFFDHVKNLTEVYATNNVIVTMGEDFNFQEADTWFKNLDKLIL